MAGIYIHIPFCRQKCYYCDFYKTVNTSLKQSFLPALKEEAKLRKNYLQNETVETIYFGGGTPSVLESGEVKKILEHLDQHFLLAENAEITFEANPDDLTKEYLQAIRAEGINRLSVGIQALQNHHLEKMNRRHDKKQALEAIENSVAAGFDNISVDLIYGLPGLTGAEWKESLAQVFRLPVQHLSAYHLTYHEGTAFYTWLRKGTLRELGESDSIEQFNLLMDEAAAAGFEQYEISNFARNGQYSQHNSAYWLGKKYLGLGPSAHSFDQRSRRWNVSHVESYIKGLAQDTSWFEEEILNDKERFNEYILTRIRTKWGVSILEIERLFGEDRKNYLLEQVEKYRKSGKIRVANDTIIIPREGLFISDEIMADLMII